MQPPKHDPRREALEELLNDHADELLDAGIAAGEGFRAFAKAQNDAKAAFLRAQTALIAAGPFLSHFAELQEREMRIAQDLSANPECIVVLDVIRPLSHETPFAYMDLWGQRFAIVRLLNTGLTAEQVRERAVQKLQEAVAMGVPRVDAWQLFV